MAFGQAVAPTVQISRRALTGSLPVLLLLAMAAAMMLATGPSTGQFHIPNLEKQSEQTYSHEIVAEANKISAIVLNAKEHDAKGWSEDQKEGYKAALAKGDPGIPALILSIGVVTGLSTKNDAVQQSVVESLISSGFGEDANAVFPEVRTEMIEAANAVKKLTTKAKDWPKNYQEWFKGCLRKGDDGLKELIHGEYMAIVEYKTKDEVFKENVATLLIDSLNFSELANAQFPEVKEAIAAEAAAAELAAEVAKAAEYVMTATLKVKEWEHPGHVKWFKTSLGSSDDVGIPVIIRGILDTDDLYKDKDVEFKQSVVESLVSSGFSKRAHALFPEVKEAIAAEAAAAELAAEVAKAAEYVKTTTSEVHDWPSKVVELLKVVESLVGSGFT